MKQFAQEKTAHLQVGQEGEDAACRFLESQYYQVLDRNVRIGAHDEIDIIAYDPIEKTLVFIEVKARTVRHGDYAPELNMHWRKRRSISRAARKWIAARDYDAGYRLDLLCIAGGRVWRHHRDIEWE